MARSKRVVATGAVVVLSAVGAAPGLASPPSRVAPIPYVPAPGAALSSSPGCPDHSGCIYRQSDYDGQRDVLDSGDAGTWRSLDASRNSAKNRFDNRKLKLGRSTGGGGGVTVLTCLDPGENRPDPGNFDEFYVSAVTSDPCG